MSAPLPLPDFAKLASAVGPAPQVAYGPPHIYPVSAPAFVAQPKAERMRPSTSPLYLYLHIPFCNYACNFCFYAKQIGAQEDQKRRYVAALLQELSWIPLGTELGELFVGGGTPTALSPELLDEVLQGVMHRLHDSGREIHTVEATPDSISDEHLVVLRKNGVRRVSMGVQSLHEKVLEAVRRRHTANDVLAACERVAAAGFNLNVDLIFGLPGYSEEMFRSDFQAVVESGVRSVTVYNLRVNRSTPVSNVIQSDERLDLERLVRWRAFIATTAAELGFVQTRWHTFERVSGDGPRYRRAPSASDSGRGHQFGAGTSARSHLGNVFYRNHEGLEGYLKRVEAGESPVEHLLVLDEGDRKAHYVARTLGDGRALDLDEYADTFGTRFEEDFSETLDRFLEGDLMVVNHRTVSLTDAGKLVYDRITEAFYPGHARQWLAQRQNSLRRQPTTTSAR